MLGSNRWPAWCWGFCALGRGRVRVCVHEGGVPNRKSEDAREVCRLNEMDKTHFLQVNCLLILVVVVIGSIVRLNCYRPYPPLPLCNIRAHARSFKTNKRHTSLTPFPIFFITIMLIGTTFPSKTCNTTTIK